MDESFLLAPQRVLKHPSKPPPTTNLIPVFEIERGTRLNSSLLFSPSARFSVIECVLSTRVGGEGG